MNNKGFAVTAVLYGLLILFVILVSSYLTVLSVRKNRVDNLIKDMEKDYYTDLENNNNSGNEGNGSSIDGGSSLNGKEEGTDGNGSSNIGDNGGNSGGNSSGITTLSHTVTLSGLGESSITTLYYTPTSGNWYTDAEQTNLISSITVPQLKGYVFKGYYTGSNGQGTQLINYNGTFVDSRIVSETITSNTTLTSFWVRESEESIS